MLNAKQLVAQTTSPVRDSRLSSSVGQLVVSVHHERAFLIQDYIRRANNSLTKPTIVYN